ncbi:MAG: hypothetical protein BGP12_13150 [Rhodospirillales bacterium 70-18]|nr:MAG: hypothetical protein BGP12_13150 [Rhodospirillales bacterium 70-18]
MNPLVGSGVVLALLGLLGLAVPVFSTQHTTEVAKIGDLKLQTTERHWYSVPPLVSGGAVVLGVVLIGAGVYRKR